MGLFKRDKSAGQQQDDALAPEERLDDSPVGSDVTSDAPSSHGPWDRGEVSDTSEYLNLGSIWLKGVPGMELRLEVNEQEQQITGVTAVLGESAVQLQAFAAPRTEGVWIEIRNEIAGTITDSGGTAEVVTGEFGEELQTRMPQAGPDGRTMFVPARFIGVDGPRWFLRAVVSGRAAIEPAAADAIHDVVRTVVVDRGDEAMPPRELLPLRLPDAATTDVRVDPAAAPRLDDLNPFERGPEITEVR
ncbi:MAG: DUF3710 domain-containing protein [Intrasporangium sp.]|uniref:DUF3710 domain-containing protein n=1 Tax=Intrasporangium sp. TaxID=1925024 RepID=UPI003F7F5C1B